MIHSPRVCFHTYSWRRIAKSLPAQTDLPALPPLSLDRERYELRDGRRWHWHWHVTHDAVGAQQITPGKAPRFGDERPFAFRGALVHRADGQGADARDRGEFEDVWRDGSSAVPSERDLWGGVTGRGRGL